MKIGEVEVYTIGENKVINALSQNLVIYHPNYGTIELPSSGLRFSVVEHVEKRPDLFGSKISFKTSVEYSPEIDIPKDVIVVVPKPIAIAATFLGIKYPFKMAVIGGYVRDGKIKKGVTNFALVEI